MDKMKWASATQRVVMLVVVLSFSAWVWAQERNVTLQIKDMRVEQALMELRKTSGYKFLFNHEEVADAGRKTLDLKKRPMSEVLNVLLENTGLTYRIEKNVVVIIPGNDISQLTATN